MIKIPKNPTRVPLPVFLRVPKCKFITGQISTIVIKIVIIIADPIVPIAPNTSPKNGTRLTVAPN